MSGETSGNPDWRKAWHRCVLRLLYPIYYRYQPDDLQFSKRLTPAGWIVFGAFGATGVLGLDSSRTRLFMLFAVLFGVVVAGMFSGLLFRPRLRGRREVPRNGSVGVPLHYTLVLENTRAELNGLYFQDDIPVRRPTFEQYADSREPAETSRNAWDRFFAFYRWQWLLGRLRSAATHRSGPVDIPAKRTSRVAMSLTPQRRGILALDRVTVLRGDLFGLRLVPRRVKRMEKSEVVVLPRRYAIPDVELAGASPYQTGGAAASRRRGRDDDFAGLRDYQSGDSPRALHWKTWARTGTPVVKEYVEEYLPRYGLVLDTAAPTSAAVSATEAPEVFEGAVSVAASFAVRLDDRESMLDLMFVGNELYTFTSERGEVMTRRLLEVLAAVDISTEADGLEDLESALLARARELTACLLVLLDWDEGRQDLVESLRRRGCVLHVMVLVPPGDGRGGSRGDGGIRFLDVERLQEDLSAW